MTFFVTASGLMIESVRSRAMVFSPESRSWQSLVLYRLNAAPQCQKAQRPPRRPPPPPPPPNPPPPPPPNPPPPPPPNPPPPPPPRLPPRPPLRSHASAPMYPTEVCIGSG